MATWVNFSAAARLPRIRQRYQKTSEFLKAARAEARGAAVWAQKRPNQSKALRIDVAAVPGVAALRKSGRKV